jgi:hypothetical protein
MDTKRFGAFRSKSLHWTGNSLVPMPYNHNFPQPPYRGSLSFPPLLVAWAGTSIICSALVISGNYGDEGWLIFGTIAVICIWTLYGEERSRRRWMEIHETRNEIEQNAKRRRGKRVGFRARSSSISRNVRLKTHGSLTRSSYCLVGAPRRRSWVTRASSHPRGCWR